MLTKKNTFNCPHCDKKIDISSLANDEFTKKLELEIENRIKKDLLKVAEDQQRKALSDQKRKLEQEIKVEFQRSYEVLKDKVENDKEIISKLKAKKTQFEIDRLEKEQEIKTLKDQNSLKVNIAVNNALKDQKSLLDNKLAEKDLQIQNLTASISNLERQSQQGSVQIQGEAGELLIEKLLASEFPTDTVEEVKKGQSGADSLLMVRNQFGFDCGSIYFEAKRTKEFSKQWIEKLKKDTSKQHANIGVLVTETMPSDKKTPHIVNGVWVTHFSDFITITKVLRHSIINIAKIKNAELLRADSAQIMFDYLISQKFADTMNAMLTPILKMSEQFDLEKRAIQRQWAMREKMIEDIIHNANNFHGHLTAVSNGRMQSFESISSFEQLN